MGEVFLAEDASLRRKVALKFLCPALQQDPIARKRFVREARATGALDHPYICHINEVAECEGKDFIVMECVEGQTLKERLDQGLLSQKEVLSIVIEVAEAVEEAHGKGIIHRDLKPANIMLTRGGHAKVMDFGLAKQLIPAGGVESQEEIQTALTQGGQCCRHSGLHVSGAAARPAHRRAQRYLGVGSSALRDGGRGAAVPGSDRI